MNVARTEELRIVTVDCRLHGRNVPEPRDIDSQHTQDCPPDPHCPYCWHGWPVPLHLRSDAAYIAYRTQMRIAEVTA